MLVVRNQEKQLTIKIDNYYISEFSTNYIKPNIKQYYIKTTLENGGEVELGKYRSKKRCLEILDEMDKALEKQNSKCNTRVVDNNGNVIKNNLSNHYFNIYYMPKK